MTENKTRYVYKYRPLSLAFMGKSVDLTYGDIPDITAVDGPLNELKTLVEEACLALDPYSRFINSYPDRSSSLEALSLLPIVVWSEKALTALESIKNESSKAPFEMSGKELGTRFSDDLNITPAKLKNLFSSLASFGIHVTPANVATVKGSWQSDQFRVALTPN